MHARFEYLLELLAAKDERLAAMLRHEIEQLFARVDSQSEQITRLRSEREAMRPKPKWWMGTSNWRGGGRRK